MKTNGRRSIVGLLAASFALAGSPLLLPAANAEPLNMETPGLLTVQEAQTALEDLSIGTSDTPYSRADFSTGWKVVTANSGSAEVEPWYGWEAYVTDGSPYAQDDVTQALEPRKGCDAREITLIRDAVDGTVEWGDDCSVITGEWYDSYTGNTVTDPSDLDIEHIVALRDAWETGADQWSPEKREGFAQNPLVLAAVDYSENREKGASIPKIEFNEDGTPVLDESGNVVEAEGGWLPSNQDEWPSYAQRYISIKSNYDLALQDEGVRDTLAYMLSLSPEIPEVEEPAPEPEPEPEVPADPVDPVEPPVESEQPAEPEPEKPADPVDPEPEPEKPAPEKPRPEKPAPEPRPEEETPVEEEAPANPIAPTGKGYKDVSGASEIEPNLLDRAYAAIEPLAGGAGNITGWSQMIKGSTLVIVAHYENAEFSYDTASGQVDVFKYEQTPEAPKATSTQDTPTSNDDNDDKPAPSAESAPSKPKESTTTETDTVTKKEVRPTERNESSSTSTTTSSDSSSYISGASASTGGFAEDSGKAGLLGSILGLLGLTGLAASRRSSKVHMN